MCKKTPKVTVWGELGLKNMIILGMSGRKSVTAWLVVSNITNLTSRQIGPGLKSHWKYFFIHALDLVSNKILLGFHNPFSNHNAYPKRSCMMQKS